jgi:peptidyl-dipeptidase Dcp
LLLVVSCAEPAAPPPVAPPPPPVATAAPLARVNPLLAPSPLVFQAPPFDRIHDDDYEPAIEEGMKQQLAEVARIADDASPPTFANTLAAMEKTGALLTRATKIFFNLGQSNTNDTLQKAQARLAPKLAAHSDAIFLNAKLFARIKAVYDARAKLGLDPESMHLVERYHLNFVRAGAELGEADKTKLRALNEEESSLTTEFQEKLLKDTNDSAVVVDSKAELDGMSDADVAGAAEAAKARKLDGKWVIALQNTTTQPALVTLKSRALRERIYKASIQRGNRGNANDLKKVITRLAAIREQRGKLLGYPNAAAYILGDQMAKTPAAVDKLLGDLAPAAVSNAKAELAKLQAVVDKQKGGFKVAPWDWAFYSEQVRKAQYDLDEAQIKPYFELDRVLKDGIFFAAEKLYGVTFKQRTDLPPYQPDVRVFEVFDEKGKSIALFYCDYFARDSKQGGAWDDSFVDQATLVGTSSVIINVTNFVKPPAGQPALLTFDDVTTMFHEFGHALHGLLSNVNYPLFTSGNTPRDFVEFPSQFNENWALDPVVFANYAKHYKTGAPMPADLAAKIKKSRTFNQGYLTTEYMAASMLDMQWHEVGGSVSPDGVDAFEQAALKRSHVDIPEVPPRYKSTYFSHIWQGGYQAGYYAYLWSEVLADDAYQWFKEHGGLKRENGQHYSDWILARGANDDPMKLYLGFRGHEPGIQALLDRRGLGKAGAKHH